MNVYRTLRSVAFGTPKVRDSIRMRLVNPTELDDVDAEMSVVIRQHVRAAAAQTYMPSMWVQFTSDRHPAEHPVQAVVFATGSAFRHCPKCNPEVCVLVHAEDYRETSEALRALTGVMGLTFQAVIRARTKSIMNTEVVA